MRHVAALDRHGGAAAVPAERGPPVDHDRTRRGAEPSGREPGAGLDGGHQRELADAGESVGHDLLLGADLPVGREVCQVASAAAGVPRRTGVRRPVGRRIEHLDDLSTGEAAAAIRDLAPSTTRRPHAPATNTTSPSSSRPTPSPAELRPLMETSGWSLTSAPYRAPGTGRTAVGRWSGAASPRATAGGDRLTPWLPPPNTARSSSACPAPTDPGITARAHGHAGTGRPRRLPTSSRSPCDASSSCRR